MPKNSLIECTNQGFEFYTNHEGTFDFLYNLHKLQEMSEETLKYHCINLHSKLNSSLHKTDLDEEWNIFRKVVPWELSALHVLKFLFQNNLSDMYPKCCHSLWNTLNSFYNNCINRKILVKILNYQKLFPISHISRATNVSFSCIN